MFNHPIEKTKSRPAGSIAAALDEILLPACAGDHQRGCGTPLTQTWRRKMRHGLELQQAAIRESKGLQGSPLVPHESSPAFLSTAYPTPGAETYGCVCTRPPDGQFCKNPQHVMSTRDKVSPDVRFRPSGRSVTREKTGRRGGCSMQLPVVAKTALRL